MTLYMYLQTATEPRGYPIRYVHVRTTVQNNRPGTRTAGAGRAEAAHGGGANVSEYRFIGIKT